MKNKVILGAGLGVAGVMAIGTGLIIRNSKKNKQEQTMEDMKVLVEEFMKKKELSIYDIKTIKFIKKLKLNGELLSEEQIKEILCNEE